MTLIGRELWLLLPHARSRFPAVESLACRRVGFGQKRDN